MANRLDPSAFGLIAFDLIAFDLIVFDLIVFDLIVFDLIVFDLIVFDMDGTLVDTRDGIAETVCDSLEELGYRRPTPREVYPLIGLPLDAVFLRFLPERTPPESEIVGSLIERYRARYREAVLPRVRPFPAVPETLAELRRSGVRLAVATSRIARMANDVLNAAGLGEAFDLVLGMDLVERPKPAPDLVEAALSAFGVPPERALVVGDTVHDVEMGHSAGATTCAVSYGAQSPEELAAARPDLLIDGFAELLSLLGAKATD